MTELHSSFPPDRLHLNHALSGLHQNGRLIFKEGQEYQAQRIVLALPPRLAAGLSFSPQLTPAQQQALTGIATWMGGQAKFVALYDRPFWREDGLSGDALSQVGPLAEIHDASPPQVELDKEAPAALFGFVGLPALARYGQKEAVTKAALAQLARLLAQRQRSPSPSPIRIGPRRSTLPRRRTNPLCDNTLHMACQHPYKTSGRGALLFV